MQYSKMPYFNCNQCGICLLPFEDTLCFMTLFKVMQHLLQLLQPLHTPPPAIVFLTLHFK